VAEKCILCISLLIFFRFRPFFQEKASNAVSKFFITGFILFSQLKQAKLIAY